MAQLSNELLPGAVLCYVAAMLGFLCEYAFGRKAAVAVAPARELVATTVGGAASASVVEPAPEAIAAPILDLTRPPLEEARRPGTVSMDPGRAAWFGRIGLGLMGLAA